MASPSLKYSESRAAMPKRAPAKISTGIEPVAGWWKFPGAYDHLATSRKGPDGKMHPMLSGLLQSNLIYWIGRKTYGSKERFEWARISITDLADICGDRQPTSIAMALADLIDRQLIEAPSREGCAKNAPKMYKLAPQNWAKARPYMPDTDADLLRLAKQVEAGWSAKADEEDDIEQARRTRVEVAPGKRSKPTALEMPVKDGESFRIRVVYHSDGFDEPVAFRARPGKNGRMDIWSSPCRPAGNVVWGDVTPGDHGKEQSAYTGPPVYGKQTFVQNTDLSGFRNYLNPLILELWDTAKDEAFIRQVFDAAEGAPLDTFKTHVEVKFSAAQGNAAFHRNARKHQPGLLIALACDAGRAWKLRQKIDKARSAEMSASEPQKPPEPLDLSRRWDRIRRALQQCLTTESYANWFSSTRQLHEDGNSTTVMVDGDQQTRNFLIDEYEVLVADVCAKLNEPGLIVWKAGK